MTTLSKDEVVKMAREAGAAPEDGVSGFWVAQTEDLQRFATLCRAPLVAEVERLIFTLTQESLARENVSALRAQLAVEVDLLKTERDDWKARALKAEQAGDRAVPDAEDYDLIDRYLRNNLDDADYGEYLAALDRLVTPQPAAQEPTSAVPVVEQLVEALERLLESVIGVDQVSAVNDTRAAIDAGRQYLKENWK